MKNIHVINLCISISLLWNFSSAQTLNSKQEMSYLADTYIIKLTELKQFNGTVLLKKGDSIVLKKAYNLQNNESNTLYVSTESQYDLRSIAKLFAKVKLHEWETEGTLNLSTPLSTHIPNFPKGDSITIKQLLNHSSGLPREFSSTTKPPVEMSATDIVEQAKKENLEFRPGTKTQYSNVGFQLVYYLVGQLSNNSYANAMRHSFFNPLDMNRSGSHFNDAIQNKTHYAFGHYLDDNKHIVCECSMPSDDMQLGNLYSTCLI